MSNCWFTLTLKFKLLYVQPFQYNLQDMLHNYSHTNYLFGSKFKLVLHTLAEIHNLFYRGLFVYWNILKRNLKYMYCKRGGPSHDTKIGNEHAQEMWLSLDLWFLQATMLAY